MDVALILVVAANLLFVIALGTVGVRLLLLSRRTRRLPEFCLGVGFCGLVLAIPALGIAGIGRGVVGDIRAPLAAIGLGLLFVSIVGQAAFTWRSFRPDSRWAGSLVAAIAIACAVICGGCLAAIYTSDPSMESFAATAIWILWIRAPLEISYVWTCTESTLNYRMARRRDRLGIGDPCVTNRFLLWCIVTFIGSVNVIISSVLHARGMSPTGDPVAAAVMGGGGAVCAVVLYLVFMPPKSYLRWVTQRSELSSQASLA